MRILSKYWAWRFSRPFKTLFWPKNSKKSPKIFLSALLYEMLPLWNSQKRNIFPRNIAHIYNNLLKFSWRGGLTIDVCRESPLLIYWWIFVFFRFSQIILQKWALNCGWWCMEFSSQIVVAIWTLFVEYISWIRNISLIFFWITGFSAKVWKNSLRKADSLIVVGTWWYQKLKYTVN